MWPYLDGRLLIQYKEMVSVYISQSFIVLEPIQFMHYAQLHDIGSSTVNLDIMFIVLYTVSLPSNVYMHSSLRYIKVYGL